MAVSAPVSAQPVRKLSRAERKMRGVIIRLMSTYGPKLSITMVGIHVRPHGTDWRTVFEDMVNDGTIIRETQNVNGRIVFIHSLAAHVDPSSVID
jgi:hypothetical protein